MLTITSKYKSQLRAKAHKLNPVVITGNQGLTKAVLNEIDHALTTHELIKIRLNAPTREDRLAMLHEICAEQSAALIQLIGHIGVIYRKKEA